MVGLGVCPRCEKSVTTRTLNVRRQSESSRLAHIAVRRHGSADFSSGCHSKFVSRIGIVHLSVLGSKPQEVGFCSVVRPESRRLFSITKPELLTSCSKWKKPVEPRCGREAKRRDRVQIDAEPPYCILLKYRQSEDTGHCSHRGRERLHNSCPCCFNNK